MELRVVCAGCFNDLVAEIRPISQQQVIVAEPCKRCVDEAFDQGRQRGDEQLFYDGHGAGYAECEEKYKDDIRAAVLATQEVCDELKAGDAKTLDSSS